MEKLNMLLNVTVVTLMANQALAGSDLCLWRIPEGLCGPMNKISCEYQSGNGSKQEIKFELAENRDFRYINGSAVKLKIGGSKESTSFMVRKEVKGSKTTTHLNYQNKFFISGIHLSFEQETSTKTLFNSVKGQWIVNYPPVIQMQCYFPWPND